MMPPRVFAVLGSVSAILAVVAGASVAVLAILICFDITARSFFRFSLQGTDELGGYTLALVGSLGLPYALLKRGHPRIDVFLGLFSKPMRAFLHVLAYGSLTGFAVFMTWHASTEFGQTLKFGTMTNTPLQTPLWVPQILWLFGTGIFAVVSGICFVHSAMLLASGDIVAVERTYGPMSVDEEVDEYIPDQPTRTLQ